MALRTFDEGTFDEGTFDGDLPAVPETTPYSALILEDEPALYWKLDEAAGTVIVDSSGNGHHGKTMFQGAEGPEGVTLNTSGRPGLGPAMLINGFWTKAPDVQHFRGSGVRADNYKPFQEGAQVTLEGWFYKTDAYSFATMFSADGGAGGANGTPHPTLEWGAAAGAGIGAQQIARWYATVNTFWIGYIDWGAVGAGHTDNGNNTFALNTWTHVALTFDDDTGVSELWIQGQSMGQQGPTAFFGALSHFDVVAEPGNFQIGFRGGPPFAPVGVGSNAEVWGGKVQHIVVHEKILTPARIRARTADPDDPDDPDPPAGNTFKLSGSRFGLVTPSEGDDPLDPADDVPATLVTLYLNTVVRPAGGGPPPGIPLEVVAVDDNGDVTFTGLTPGTVYAAYAQVAGEDVWVTFVPPRGQGPN